MTSNRKRAASKDLARDTDLDLPTIEPGLYHDEHNIYKSIFNSIEIRKHLEHERR